MNLLKLCLVLNLPDYVDGKKEIIEKELDIEETHLKKDAFSDKKVWIKKYQKKKRKKATKI